MNTTQHGDKRRDNRKKRNAAEAGGGFKWLFELKNDLVRASLPQLFIAFVIAIIVFALALWLVERSDEGMFKNLFDGIWWAVVTIATVGYGDKYPVSEAGKVLGILLIATGIVLTSLISGTVASVFVDRRIREGKGLQVLKLKNHAIVCGWNANSSGLLSGFAAAEDAKNIPIAMVNALEPEKFDAIKAQFPSLDLRFVRGDFTHEAVLKRAGAAQAKSCVIIPDSSGPYTFANADERTILGALALKALSSETVVSAEILHPENEQHLKRANVDNILVNGEFSGFLLSTASFSQGIPKAVRELLSFASSTRIRQAAMPQPLVGKPFDEASDWFLKNGKGLLIGVLSQEKQMSLDDLLSEDSSAIDAFIKRKFMEAEIDLGGERQTGAEVRLNPGAGYLIRETDAAFVIG